MSSEEGDSGLVATSAAGGGVDASKEPNAPPLALDPLHPAAKPPSDVTRVTHAAGRAMDRRSRRRGEEREPSARGVRIGVACERGGGDARGAARHAWRGARGVAGCSHVVCAGCVIPKAVENCDFFPPPPRGNNPLPNTPHPRVRLGNHAYPRAPSLSAHHRSSRALPPTAAAPPAVVPLE